MCTRVMCLVSFVLLLALAASASAWTDLTIGDELQGSATEEPPGTWTVIGNGHDIWDNADDFHFVYKYLQGDGSITARVADRGPGSNAWMKAGVMMRESLDAGSRHAMEVVTGGDGGGLAFQWRPTTDGGSVWSDVWTPVVAEPPYWVRVVRTGDLFEGFHSPDGVDWTKELDIEIPIRGGVAGSYAGCYIGLCMTSHATGELREATFDNVSYTGDVTEQPPPQLKAYGPNPSDGAVGVETPLLQWMPGDTAVFHRVYFGTNPTLTEADFVMEQTWLVYWHGAGLVAGTTYYWRVDEKEADGTVHEGDLWSFSAPPLTAWNPAPPDGAKYVLTDIDLTWAPGFGATSHDVYLGTDQTEVADGTGDTFKGDETAPRFSLTGLANSTTYFWRIDETDGGGKHTGDVWSFTTLPAIAIADPNLLGWWKLDEGYGNTAIDWSGHANHGTLMGDPEWMPGYDGYAVQFDGAGDYVEIPMANVTAYTIAAWIKPSQTGPVSIIVRTSGSGSTTHWSHQLRITPTGVVEHYTYDGAEKRVVGRTQIQADTWCHVAGVASNSGPMYLYVNGKREGGSAQVGALWSAGDRFQIGSNSGHGMGWFDGIIDDARVYDKVLSQEEIGLAMRGDPLLAWKPKPANGSVPDAEGAAQLSWLPGDNAMQHDVYFGTEMDAVADADTSDATGVYRGRQGGTGYIPGVLEWGKTYFWRIDEYNNDATVSTGRLWSFTVAEYLIIDDFEDYNDYSPDRIFQTWLDGWGYTDPPPGKEGNGTGSTIGYLTAPFAEQTTVHGGGQSMPYGFDLTAFPFYAEAEREFTMAQDFTRKGVKSLSLWVYGDSNSAPAPLYVGLQDSAGTRIDVPDTSTSRVRTTSWQEVNIELSEFAPVSLTSVKKIFIGVGNRLAPMVGGIGDLFIDDIRLYRPRCVASLLKPDADLSGNCVVDYLDVEMLSADWLLTDVTESVWDAPFTNADVGVPLAGSYSFDGTTYTVTGNGHDIWDEADNFHFAYHQISGDCQMTVRVKSMTQVHAWAKAGVMIRDTLDAGSPNAMIAVTGGDGDGGTFQWRTDPDATCGSSRTLTGITPPACVRLVREGDTFTGYIFLDGRWQQEGTSTDVVMTDPVYIGLAVTSHTDGVLETAT
ncbi:MAG: hypothetical protein JSU70_01160, partial [Phycisphaerales bacterium]